MNAEDKLDEYRKRFGEPFPRTAYGFACDDDIIAEINKALSTGIPVNPCASGDPLAIY